MRSRIAAAAGFCVGLWMMAAPAVLGYAGSAATSDRIVGPTAAAIAWIAASEVTRSLRWVNVALGAWAIASPLLLDHSAAAALSDVSSGMLLVITALVIEPIPKSRFAGGWRALAEPHEASRPEDL